MNFLRKLYLYFFVALLGAVIYGLTEILFRGRTHWTMGATGGVALVLLFLINRRLSSSHLLLRCLAGCAAITAIELVVGMIVNLRLGMNVWDYSHMPLNLYGQICPLFSGVWFLLCIPGMKLCDFLDRRLSGENQE